MIFSNRLQAPASRYSSDIAAAWRLPRFPFDGK